MKIALWIVSVVAVVMTGLLIWQAYEAKKAKEKNKVLDPANVVTKEIVSDVLAPTATKPESVQAVVEASTTARRVAVA